LNIADHAAMSYVLIVHAHVQISCLLVKVCVCAFTFIQLQEQIRARTWCCKVVGSCKLQFSTSSQLGPRRWMLKRPMM